MSLSIEDLETIKAIVRHVVRDELKRVVHHEAVSEPVQPPAVLRQAEQGQTTEVVARISRS